MPLSTLGTYRAKHSQRNHIVNEPASAINSDQVDCPVSIVDLQAEKKPTEYPIHKHDKGQLVMPIKGAITCSVSDAIWLVPTQCAVWIPAGLPHSNYPSANARYCFLFIQDNQYEMPSTCCTLAISPMVREIILYLSTLPLNKGQDRPTQKLIEVLLYQLTQMPKEFLHFPIPTEPRLKRVAEELITSPSSQRTAEQWAQKHAMSVRTFARLLKKETAMTFRHWRRQLHIIIALQKLSTGTNVQTVSEELGYESVSAFISMFKSVLGKTPKQYILTQELKQSPSKPVNNSAPKNRE